MTIKTSTDQWHILCDFDGTISLTDTTDYLLNHFAGQGWLDIEKQWERGLIGSRVCMQKQIALLDISAIELIENLEQIAIDQGFIDFIKKCDQLNLDITIVSDGLDFVIKTILKRYQLDHIPIVANHLKQKTINTWELEFPNSNPQCLAESGTCKCKIAQINSPNKILLIGDGRSDFCLSDRADYVFAKKSLQSYCENNGIPHTAFHQFKDLLPALDLLVKPSYSFSDLGDCHV